MVQSQTNSLNNTSYSSHYLLTATSIVVAACWLFITVLSRNPGHWAVLQFLTASAIMVAGTALVVWRYHYTEQSIPFIWILLSACLLRLLSLNGDPLFEDDYYRYMWDGYQTVATLDPYSLAPSVYFDSDDVPEAFEPILSLINYPEIATVYGPVTQWIFGLGYLIQAAEVWPLQLMAGLADLTILILLSRLGAGNALLFYAWSPLLLKEFSLTAHPDIYAILAVVFSIFAVSRNKVWLAGVSLALGVGAKVFAIIVLPYLLSQRWSPHYWRCLISAFIATMVLITLSFGTLTVWAPEGLQAMAESWLFNSAVYLLLLKVLSFQSIKLLLLGVFVIYVLTSCLRRAHIARMAKGKLSTNLQSTAAWNVSTGAFRGDWLFMILLLALPVVNAWYVAWVLPFACLFPRWWSWALSYFCLMSYWTGANAGATGTESLALPHGIIAIEYSAVIVLVVMAWLVSSRHSTYQDYTRL